MKCLFCGKEFTPKRADAKFCSDKCRKAYSRKADNSKIISDKSRIISDKMSEIKADKIISDRPYRYTGKTLYGRKEVIYPFEENGVVASSGAEWRSRPEPQNPDDIPDPDNRNCYKRKDGSEYSISATGQI